MFIYYLAIGTSLDAIFQKATNYTPTSPHNTNLPRQNFTFNTTYGINGFPSSITLIEVNSFGENLLPLRIRRT